MMGGKAAAEVLLACREVRAARSHSLLPCRVLACDPVDLQLSTAAAALPEQHAAGWSDMPCGNALRLVACQLQHIPHSAPTRVHPCQPASALVPAPTLSGGRLQQLD